MKTKNEMMIDLSLAIYSIIVYSIKHSLRFPINHLNLEQNAFKLGFTLESHTPIKSISFNLYFCAVYTDNKY